MVQIFLIILGIVIVAFLISRKTREAAAGICATALDQTVRKNGNKEKVLAFIRERGEVSNLDIRNYLGVSSRTVVNYLDELEKEGIVEQKGNIGQGVFYRLK